MNWYNLEPTCKYAINEVFNFVNDEKKVKFVVHTNWKRGTMTVSSEEKLDTNTEHKFDEQDLYGVFDECQIDWFDSGNEEFVFVDLNTGEEIKQTDEHEKFIEQYYDEGVNFLDDNGYVEDDPELYIEGGVVLEETQDPYEQFNH
jgi:hypothetical protein